MAIGLLLVGIKLSIAARREPWGSLRFEFDDYRPLGNLRKNRCALKIFYKRRQINALRRPQTAGRKKAGALPRLFCAR